MRNVLIAATFLTSAQVFAGGFAVSEQDAAASGRSGTGIAQVQTASSVHYNPAGLAGQQGVFATAGVTAISAPVTATDPSTGSVDRTQGGIKTPPHAYVGYGNGKWSFGGGVNAPFGGGVKWDDNWRGRFELVEMKLQVFGGHVGGAYQINDRLSVGATGSIYNASIEISKRADFVDSEGTALLGGTGTGFGAGVGVSYQALQSLRVGATAKIPTAIPLSGRAHFSDVPDAYKNTLPDQEIKSSLTLPGKVGVGMQGDLGVGRLFADVEYTMWSSFRSLDIDFAEGQTPDVSQTRNWRNALTFRVGGEKEVANTTLRAGVVLDDSTGPADTLSPSSPDATRLGFSIGAGRDIGPVRADLAYQLIALLPRSSDGDAFAAQYSATAHLVALSISFKTPSVDRDDPLDPPPLIEAQPAVAMASK